MADRFPNTDGTWLALASMGLLTLAGSAELGSRNDKQIPVVYLAGTSASDIPNWNQWNSWVNYTGWSGRYSDPCFGNADLYWEKHFEKEGRKRVSYGTRSRSASTVGHERIKIFTPEGDLPKGTRIGNVGPGDSIRAIATLSGRGMTYVEARMGGWEKPTLYRITADLLSVHDRMRLRTIYLREKDGNPRQFEDDKHMAALDALVDRLCEVRAGTALPLRSWGITLEDEKKYLMEEIGWLKSHAYRVDRDGYRIRDND